MRNFNMHPLDQVFLLLRRVTVLDFFVFNVCPWTSQWVSWVLNVFPNMLVTSSHMLCPKLASRNLYNRAYIAWFYACNEEFCMGGCLQGFRTFFVMGWSNRLIAKKNTWAWKGPQTNYYRSQYISTKMWHLRWWNSADIKMMMASCVRILHLGRPCGL